MRVTKITCDAQTMPVLENERNKTMALFILTIVTFAGQNFMRNSASKSVECSTNGMQTLENLKSKKINSWYVPIISQRTRTNIFFLSKAKIKVMHV